MTDEERRAQKAGYQRKFRATHPEADKRYRAAHSGDDAYRKRAIESQKKYIVTHRKEICAQKAAYNAMHKEQIAVYKKKYEATHKDQINARRRRSRPAAVLSAEQRERSRMFIREWGKRNRLKKNLVDAKRRAESTVNTPIDELLTEAQWHEILERYGFRCAYCGCKLAYGVPGSVPTMDHVIPLSKGGMHSKNNIVSACGHCNCVKRARTPEQWTGLSI